MATVTSVSGCPARFSSVRNNCEVRTDTGESAGAAMLPLHPRDTAASHIRTPPRSLREGGGVGGDAPAAGGGGGGTRGGGRGATSGPALTLLIMLSKFTQY